jgi:hypothetical protein
VEVMNNDYFCGMKAIFTSLFSLWLAATGVSATAQVFRTEPLSDAVGTLRVFPVGKWDAPAVVYLRGGEAVEVNFDLLGGTAEHLTYRVLHCNADWTLSSLAQPEYLDGLQNNPVEDYAYSFNTTMAYVNYRLLIPNERVGLRVSGNYVVQVVPAGDTRPVLNACFSVVEPQTEIRMQVSPTTDRGVQTRFQAVSFEVGYGNDIKSPVQDLKVYVLQNNRFDNMASLVKPLSLQNRKAVYDHSPALIFEAGNEYRSFEMTTTHYAGLGVESVEFFDPYYHTILKPDVLRGNRAYLFGEDINGRVFVRNNDVESPDTEADYQFVHFYLPCDRAFREDVFLLSEAFNGVLDARSQMTYSAADGGYVKSVLLKEGYYNYLYVSRTSEASAASVSLIEGSFYQTENEYRVMVYARPMGWRYDRLIGVQSVQFK